MAESKAESLITLSAQAAAATGEDILATARVAGILAAKRASDLLPLCPALVIRETEIIFEPRQGAIRITAIVRAETDAPTQALTAAAVAALALYDAIKSIDTAAAIESVKLAVKEAPRKSAALRPSPISTRGTRVTPRTIMGEVVGPRAEADPTRDAFRAFMMRGRLRATTWAKDAGVPVGEILAFLTGSSRGFSSETAAKLARAAKVKPEDMFR